MAFTIPLTLEWLKHRLFAAQRILYGRSNEYFIDRHPDLLAVRGQDNELISCPICGFLMADLKIKDNWSARACSATGFKNIINNPHFDNWFGKVINKKEPSEQVSDNSLSIKLK